MSEDKVLRPVFGGRKDDAVASESSSPPNEAPDLEHDVAYCFSNLELVWKAHLRGDEMTNYLFDDVGYQKTDASLELRRPVVRGYSFEQFCDRLMNSSPAEWLAQPAFFGALFIEFHERQNLILLSLDQRREQVNALPGEHKTILLQLVVRMNS
jgi:hypothetical protein